MGQVLGGAFLLAFAYAQWKYPERFRGYYYRMEKIRRPERKPTERALANRRRVDTAIAATFGIAGLVLAISGLVR
jgi:hypothetical protein